MYAAKKPTRQWAAWTHQEEESFFTALRQVGKVSPFEVEWVLASLFFFWLYVSDILVVLNFAEFS